MTLVFVSIAISYQYDVLMNDRIDRLEAITQAASGIADHYRALVQSGARREDAREPDQLTAEVIRFVAEVRAA